MYVFLLDNYQDYCLQRNGNFRYHWLLKKVTDTHGNEKLIPPVKIPDYENNSNSDLAYFEKFLEYLKRVIRPFSQISGL